MALVTGDECGLLKLADLHRNRATRIDEHEVQARSRGVLKIATSAVDATTGCVRVKCDGCLDYETTASYALTVSATDSTDQAVDVAQLQAGLLRDLTRLGEESQRQMWNRPECDRAHHSSRKTPTALTLQYL